MSTDDVLNDVAAIKERLAALANDPNAVITGAEIGAIRAQLRELAEDNAGVAQGLGRMLEKPSA